MEISATELNEPLSSSTTAPLDPYLQALLGPDIYPLSLKELMEEQWQRKGVAFPLHKAGWLPSNNGTCPIDSVYRLRTSQRWLAFRYRYLLRIRCAIMGSVRRKGLRIASHPKKHPRFWS